MLSALTQFIENIRRADELGGIAAAIRALTSTAIDVTDLWRAQIVLLVSSFDHFVHEIVRIGMIDIAKGNRKKTDHYLKYQIPLSTIEAALMGLPHEVWMGGTVQEKHSWLSFQDPDKVANAIRLISSEVLWERVGKEIGLTAEDTKIRMKLIADRRNKIAHEADMDPTNPGFRWPITDKDVRETREFLHKVGVAIHKVVA